jgi:UDP-N-acetylmuramoyl-L-alanyl-D-glutamate--2,6-diaminopimelate ligase
MPANAYQFSTKRMSLQILLSDFVADQDLGLEGLMVSGLSLDSRTVSKGDLFFALKGAQHDGLSFIKTAKERGAVSVVTDAPALNDDFITDLDIPVVQVPGLKKSLGEIAARFFDNPSRHMDVVGITGTNGKTSCCQFIAQALGRLEVPCAVIGTNGYGAINELHDFGQTTPDPIMLQRILAELLGEKFQVIAMEVSSHGLDQGRTNGVRFNTAIFTNLTRDHLDYHGDMKAYGESKAKLFSHTEIKQAIINVDDPFGRQLADKVKAPIKVYRYAVDDQTADVSVSNIKITNGRTRALVRSPWGSGIVSSPLLGRFNISNLLAAFTYLCAQGITLDRALGAVADLDTVDGRMQRFGGDSLPVIVVDYAHTPDALKSVLITLREICPGKLWCVFGCGGNRDKGKRGMMGRFAEQYADQVVLTNDNPRQENPEDIIRDIKAGMKRPADAQIILNRVTAIQETIASAGENDLVLIAGKGHEGYQEIGGARFAFNDGEQVKQALTIKRAVKQNSMQNNHDDDTT